MQHYINLLFRADEEVPLYFIRNKVFTKLHKALHDQKQTSIGVSFPDYKVKLGEVIRVHGNQNELQSLQDSNWLGGLSGYCEVSDILPVPETVEGYRTISRVQPTMTLKKLRKRVTYQKANGILKTDEEIITYIQQYRKRMFSSSLENPYLELQSLSNGNRYRVFIKMCEIQTTPVAGDFNHFGLSKTATIPWF